MTRPQIEIRRKGNPLYSPEGKEKWGILPKGKRVDVSESLSVEYHCSGQNRWVKIISKSGRQRTDFVGPGIYNITNSGAKLVHSR